VKFRKIWQTVNKYFTLVGAPFPGKSIGPLFGRVIRDKLEKIETKRLYTSPTFLVLNIHKILPNEIQENHK